MYKRGGHVRGAAGAEVERRRREFRGAAGAHVSPSPLGRGLLKVATLGAFLALFLQFSYLV